MIRVLHLIEETAHDDAWITLRQIITHAPSPDTEHVIGLIGGTAKPGFEAIGASVVRWRRCGLWPLAAAVPVRRTAQGRAIDVLHAWSDGAAAAAHLAADGRQGLVITAVEPPAGNRWGRWWASCRERSGGPSPAFVLPSQRLRRRAREAGIPAESCGVIRPAVDFRLLRDARAPSRRSELGIAEGVPVLLTPPSPSRAGGHYHAVWAGAILQKLWPDLRIIVPGVSTESRRLGRFVASFGEPGLLIAPGERFPFEALLAVADVMLVPAIADVPTGAIAWAMAAGVPIVGSAIPCVAEYLADHHNALLCRAGNPTALAARVRLLLRDPSLSRRLREVAQGEAFEAFSLSRLAREYRTVYGNVAAGRDPFAAAQNSRLPA